MLVWLWLALFRGMFWRTDVRLPPLGADPVRWPLVAVVVPARDEAAILPGTLPTLLAQDYPGPVRLILVDDNSGDGTRELVASRWPRFGVVGPGEPAAGWAGKLWALRAGIGEAGPVDLLLLTDADIAHRPGSLRALVRAAEANRLDLVSQMARLRVHTGWERLVVPAFVYFFAMLFPFRWSNAPGARTAAAAAGCSLVRRAALDRAGGLEAIRAAVIDDVALAGLLKRSGSRTFLGLADLQESVRPYDGLGPLWRMVSRSAYAQLRHSVVARRRRRLDRLVQPPLLGQCFLSLWAERVGVRGDRLERATGRQAHEDEQRQREDDDRGDHHHHAAGQVATHRVPPVLQCGRGRRRCRREPARGGDGRISRERLAVRAPCPRVRGYGDAYTGPGPRESVSHAPPVRGCIVAERTDDV